MDRREQARFHRLVGVADDRLEWRYHVADHVFRGIVQQNAQTRCPVEPRARARDRFDQQRMLGDGQDVRALGLPVPAGDAREPVRDVGDLDVERGRVEQIEPAPGQHALPSAECLGRYWPLRLCRHRAQRPASAANGAWRWQLTTWPLTLPVACMQAYAMLGPTHLEPLRESSLHIGPRDGLSAGTCEVERKRLTLGMPPTKSQSSREKPGPVSIASRYARAERTAPSIFMRLRTMPASCISFSIFFGV